MTAPAEKKDLGEKPVIHKRKRGRPPRPNPGERIHIYLSTDATRLLRKDRDILGVNYSMLVEQLILNHYARAAQAAKKELF